MVSCAMALAICTTLFFRESIARIKAFFFVPSAIISLNQRVIALVVKTKPKLRSQPPGTKPCIYKSADTTKPNKAKLVNNGQGD